MFKPFAPILLWVCIPVMSAAADEPQQESIDDIQCVVVGMRIAGARNASQQSAGTMLALYYIGRLDGRDPKLDLESALAKEVVKMTPAELREAATRCGARLTEKGQELTKIGQDMLELSQKVLDKANGPPTN